jgi:hypothetical protein
MICFGGNSPRVTVIRDTSKGKSPQFGNSTVLEPRYFRSAQLLRTNSLQQQTEDGREAVRLIARFPVTRN